MVGAPLGRHVALTLALSRRAGEGTCCCLRGYCCEDRGWWFGGGGCCGEFRASPCSLRSRPPSLCEGGWEGVGLHIWGELLAYTPVNVLHSLG